MNPRPARTGSLELLLPPRVLDTGEISELGRSGKAAGIDGGRGPAIAGAAVPVRSLALPGEIEIRTDTLAPLARPAMRRFMPLGRPGVRSRQLMAAGTAVRSANLLAPARRRSQADRKVRLLAGPAVRDGSARFARMPHSRRSINLETLGERERLDYLREAELVRGVPPERGELLGVFRKVPVELVLRMRFLAQNGLLLYTIARPPGLQRTRLHDLAVVRNRDGGGAHLVAHRTRYRTAFLA